MRAIASMGMGCNAGARPMTTLRRAIRLPQATALVVGTIIGASIFVQPAEITAHVHSIPGVLAVWLVAGALTLVGALVCADLAALFPQAGGVYVFLREAFSPAVGFLWGWAMFWSVHSGILAAVAVIFARYVGTFAPLGDVGARVVAIAAILLLSAINVVGVRFGARLQTAFTAVKLVAIAAMIVAGLVLGAPRAHFVAGVEALEATTASGFSLAVIAGLFAFGGWHMVTYSAEETRAARRTVPRALLYGTVIVTLTYLALNTVYLYVLPLDAVASSTRIAADAADAVLGSGGAAIMSALVVFSAFGALAGIVLAGPRVYFSMARDGLLFPWIAAVHPTFRTPHRALALQAVWASVLVATGTYRALFVRVIYTEWIFFALMALGLVLLYRRRDPAGPTARRPLSILRSTILPLLFVASSLVIVASQVLREPVDTALGLGLVLLGLPVYAWSRRRFRTVPHSSAHEAERDDAGSDRDGMALRSEDDRLR
jgi:APA family basic amino acid/polyamine antiporter